MRGEPQISGSVQSKTPTLTSLPYLCSNKVCLLTGRGSRGVGGLSQTNGMRKNWFSLLSSRKGLKDSVTTIHAYWITFRGAGTPEAQSWGRNGSPRSGISLCRKRWAGKGPGVHRRTHWDETGAPHSILCCKAKNTQYGDGGESRGSSRTHRLFKSSLFHLQNSFIRYIT